MKKFLLILISITTLVLAACGGGGSSSDTSAPSNQFFGAQTINFLGNSNNSQLVMTITDTTVTINDEVFTASGPLESNNFNVTIPPTTLTDNGVTCTFNFSYIGSLETPDRATGVIRGLASCNGVLVTITGNFAANRG